jgi:pantoate--beta-alanine ligase
VDLIDSPAAMRKWRSHQSGTVGLVPTMGYLHEGHLGLARRSLEDNDLTVVSIFVNPAQFGPNEDLDRYPRDEERDLRLLRELGVHAVYLPSPNTMYPENYETYVEPGRTAAPLEGASRPGHFRGVLTVVLKLLTAVRPDRAYFGRKDAQQLRVIRRMVVDFDLGIEVVPCPIVREDDGLAMSSRNVYLKPEERTAAVVLNRALSEAAAAFDAGERDAGRLRGIIRSRIEGEPLAAIDYVSVADDGSLEEIDGRIAGRALASLAVRFGSTRLIDNVELG